MLLQKGPLFGGIGQLRRCRVPRGRCQAPCPPGCPGCVSPSPTGVPDRRCGHEIEVQEVLQEAEVPCGIGPWDRLSKGPLQHLKGLPHLSPASQLRIAAMKCQEVQEAEVPPASVLGGFVQRPFATISPAPQQPPPRISAPSAWPQEPHPLSSQQVASMLPLPPRGGCRASHQLRPLSDALHDLLDPAACLLLGRTAGAAPSSRSWGPATSNEGGLQKLFGLITCGYGKSLKSDRQKTAAHVVP